MQPFKKSRWLHGKESCQCRNCRRCGFDPWVRKILWRRKWQLTPVFLPGEAHGQRNLAGCTPWGHKVSDSIEPFSSCPQSFPASGSFPMSRLLASDGQSIGASASASVLPMNIQGWFPLGLIGLISLLSKGLSKSLLQHHSLKASLFWRTAFFMVQVSQLCMTTGKTIALTIRTFVSKLMSLLFNILSRFVIAFLSRSKLSYLDTSNHPWNFSWEATPLSTQSYYTVAP